VPLESTNNVEAQASGRRPASRVFEILGRLFSIFVLAGALFLGGSSPLVLLWGLWIEEIFSFIGLSARKTTARRAGAETPRLGPYFAFPAAHLVFVLFFTLIGMTGLFARPGSTLFAPPSTASLVEVAAAFLLWTSVDVVRTVLRLHREGPAKDELAAIDMAARLALFLPHVTIIAGGFCLVMLGLGNWLAWGILAGKVLFELFSVAIARDKIQRAG
jgi:hypothetical protein